MLLNTWSDHFLALYLSPKQILPVVCNSDTSLQHYNLCQAPRSIHQQPLKKKLVRKTQSSSTPLSLSQMISVTFQCVKLTWLLRQPAQQTGVENVFIVCLRWDEAKQFEVMNEGLEKKDRESVFLLKYYSLYYNNISRPSLFFNVMLPFSKAKQYYCLKLN